MYRHQISITVRMYIKIWKRHHFWLMLVLWEKRFPSITILQRQTDWCPFWQSHCVMLCWRLGLSHSFYVTYGPNCPHKHGLIRARHSRISAAKHWSIQTLPTLVHPKGNGQEGCGDAVDKNSPSAENSYARFSDKQTGHLTSILADFSLFSTGKPIFYIKNSIPVFMDIHHCGPALNTVNGFMVSRRRAFL